MCKRFTVLMAVAYSAIAFSFYYGHVEHARIASGGADDPIASCAIASPAIIALVALLVDARLRRIERHLQNTEDKEKPTTRDKVS
jgi:hypothetical protein